ncbi:MAG TPA: hypothetical protein VFG84_02080 [Gemmatimonadaceae bacterium]|nr:hypothetical protein [Gemmatimonadaceae bacterium]
MTNVLDMIGATAGVAVYALMAGVLVGASRMSTALKVKFLVAAGLWLVLMITIAGAGGFERGVTGAVPAPVLAFVAFLALLLAAWFRIPAFRDALWSLPLGALIGLNVARLGGISFVLLEAQHRLSEPFAPVAGYGDMLVGALAIPLALMTLRRDSIAPRWAGLWNALGAADLVVAVTLASLSAPGTPFRVFTDDPGTLAMTSLPWVMVPTLLVPVYFLIHFAVAVRLRGASAPSALRRTAEPVAQAQ